MIGEYQPSAFHHLAVSPIVGHDVADVAAQTVAMTRLGRIYGKAFSGDAWALASSLEDRIAVQVKPDHDLAERYGRAVPSGQCVHGLTCWPSDPLVRIEVLINKDIDAGEQNAALAHELGHVVFRLEFGRQPVAEAAIEAFAQAFVADA